ncbi:MAG: 2-hydroxyacyl-CoA dehydratase family protein [Chloroflexi bacterium]|nr:2-hydroxyacyl-CoA dehydratase family protein [Chloroflexota bacterium]
MPDLKRLSDYTKARAAELQELKRRGKKIVGYFPGGYMPEELVYACGAVPVALNRGGDHEAVEVAGSYIVRWVYTFGRAHIGYKMLGTEPIYNLIDILVVPITDNHVRITADAWDVFTDVEVFRFGVPHVKHDRALGYYATGLLSLKERLEKLTGTKITEEKLKAAIDLSNRERGLLKEISLMRTGDRPPITAMDFIALNHSSMVLDKQVMVEMLESLCAGLRGKEGPPAGHPRILLMGSTLAHGDYKVLDMIEKAGGTVVIEEFGEGIRHYWESVRPNGDLIEALADRYFARRVPPEWFRPGRERQEFVVSLAKIFRVDGVSWYQLTNRESSDFESYWYPDVLKKEAGVPMLKLQSDYDAGERGQMSTRIETFMEMVRR